jgi:GNAT superfamily N-acetyltransferase
MKKGWEWRHFRRNTAARVATRQLRRRWQTLDPLLPAPAPLAPGCGASLRTGRRGLVAAGSCEHWLGEPGAMDMTWGSARRFRLTPHIAGPQVRPALDELLSRWRDHLAGLPGTGGDSAAVVLWPCRDIDGIIPLQDHGFVPRGVLAARVPRASPGPGSAGAAGVRIRRAGPADLDTVARLGLGTIRYDAHFGGVIERPWTAAALRAEVAGLLSGPRPWTWLAERDGTPVGLLIGEPPAAAGWIAPLTGLAPAAYLFLMFVLPAERGHGVGAALTGLFHQEAADAGVAVTLLHHEQANPLSAPFWAQQGYRPLWTSWEARPAGTVR